MDLESHFLECAKIGRYLTMVDESRFIITDDFGKNTTIGSIASAAVSVFSRDELVAESALIPLGLNANRVRTAGMGQYEELFNLIERTALSSQVRDTAQQVLKANFRISRIRDLEKKLNGLISPARMRYRGFLEIVRQLIEKRVSVSGFRDEFLEFTIAVAGKLDFGIFSYCLDRIFINSDIPLNAKGALIAEIIRFPHLIRRELLTNALSHPNQDRRLIEFIRETLESQLDNEAVVEIYLLVTLKKSNLSFDDVRNRFMEIKN